MENKKRIKKKVKIKIVPILITIAVVAILAFIIYFISLLPISNIYIKGNNYLSDQEIIELSKIDDYPSFFKTTKYRIKKRLLKNPYIKNVKVKKSMFNTIEISVVEKNILCRKDDNKLVILEDGKEVDDNNKYDVPILLNYIPDTKYKSFLKHMNRVNDSIKSEISEIRYYPNEQDDDRFLLHMNDGNVVYLTLTKFSQINYYESVLDQLEGKKGILYLDSGNHFRVME